jgi:hypothetical protein
MVKSSICDLVISQSMMLLAKESTIGIKNHVTEKGGKK